MTPRELNTGGRVPPQDIEAEESVLGSILLDWERSLGAVMELLGAQDFYRENHRQVYEAALDLYQADEPIDLVTLGNRLQEKGVLERVGGRAFLARIQETVPTTANAEYYARIVREKAQRRRLIGAGGEVTALGFDEGLDADEALNRAQGVVFEIADQRITVGLEHVYPLLKGAMEKVERSMTGTRGTIGVPSGFIDLDNMTNGFKESDLVIVAGRPSMGKTSFALNIALHAAVQHKVPIAIFSLEMSKEQLVERLLCQQAAIDSSRLHRGLLSDREFQQLVDAIGPLESAPIYIDESPVLDELTLVMKARQAHMRHKIGMVVIDYLQLMKGRSGKDDNRVQEVSSISRSLKGLARQLKVPVIALSQLSRGPENRTDKRPLLSDLRESGSIEQDADMVLFLYRDEYYYPDKPDVRGIAEVLVQKHRNGPTGVVKLRFRHEQTRFYNLEQRRAPADFDE